jgi:hypothetical protein
MVSVKVASLNLHEKASSTKTLDIPDEEKFGDNKVATSSRYQRRTDNTMVK